MSAEPAVLEHDIWIEARPQIVFAFFTDAEKLLRWKGLAATLEPEPGGTFRVNLNGRDVIRGAYIELVPYSRIVFSWGWEGAESPLPPGSSRVEVTLAPESDGTRVRLRHSGLHDAALRQRHAQGWDHYLARLSQAASSRDPGPDPLAAIDGGSEEIRA